MEKWERSRNLLLEEMWKSRIGVCVYIEGRNWLCFEDMNVRYGRRDKSGVVCFGGYFEGEIGVDSFKYFTVIFRSVSKKTS